MVSSNAGEIIAGYRTYRATIHQDIVDMVASGWRDGESLVSTIVNRHRAGR